VLSERASVSAMKGLAPGHLWGPCVHAKIWRTRILRRDRALRQITVETKDGKKAWTEDQVLKVRLLTLPTHGNAEHWGSSGGPIPRRTGLGAVGRGMGVTAQREGGNQGGVGARCA
jgi:hypothetical protein